MEEKLDVLNELGEFTGKIATREECHKKGLWHRAVYAFIIDEKGNILLQKRSSNKKLWPNMWDVTVGGHVDAGEFGRQALIREVKEELGIEINDDDIKYLVGSTSINKQGDIINKHYNECYLITKNIDISDIKIQIEEVSEVRYFSKKELLERISNNYEGLTDKTGPWNFLERILEQYV
ncbi:MAG: NUDIX domain-containing protein [Clostridia bacterium]|nr:NUDIX domain-containing protein [Clostridia bacterium]